MVVREGLNKHQLATSATTIMENVENEMLGMLTMMDADSFACACGILDSVVPEQKKGNLKLLLKYILRQFNFEDVKGSDVGGSSRYTELHDHRRVSFPQKIMHLLFLNKNLKSVKTACLTVTSFLKI